MSYTISYYHVAAALVAGLAFSAPSWSAIPVEEAGAISPTTRQPSYQSNTHITQQIATQQTAQTQQQSQTQAEFFYQLQLLQEEVQTLRGLVESQTNEIKKLKQERLEGYLNLDRRLSELSGQMSKASLRPSASNLNAKLTEGAQPAIGLAVDAPGVATTQQPDAELEKRRYKQARALLKSKDYQGAIQAFNSLVDDFPNGNYASNAYYWLGEIYLVLRESGEAKKAFLTLLDRYPTGRKVPDALYKLGVLHAEGDQVNSQLSQQYFDRLLKDYSSTSAARLAQDFMRRR